MPHLSTQTRFLLRGSTLLIGLLVVWWFLLLNPMLAGLRATVETTGGLFFGGRSSDLVHETAGGDWTMHVPMDALIPATAQGPATQIHSLDFDLVRTDINAFTFSLPVFWAIMLAAPNLRRNLRALALGTAIMAAIEFLLLMLFAEICGRNAIAQLTQTQGAAEKWLLHFGEYLAVSVIPYAAPFVLALCCHRDLRRQILGWVTEPVVPVTAPILSAKRKVRLTR